MQLVGKLLPRQTTRHTLFTRPREPHVAVAGLLLHISPSAALKVTARQQHKAAMVDDSSEPRDASDASRHSPENWRVGMCDSQKPVAVRVA